MLCPNCQIRPAAALGMLLIATVAATPADAQPHSRPRVEISANVGALTLAKKFTESEAFPVNAETETVTIQHDGKAAVTFSVGGAVRIVPRFWVGIQYAIADSKADAALTAMVPHPLLFNAPRTVQGSVKAVAHNEGNVHVDLMYALPVRAIDVKVLAGPTFFSVKQDFVSSVTVVETYPFDTATFGTASITRASKSMAGFNAGVDISRPISPVVAVGALIRYSRGDVKFDNAGNGRQTVKAGGVEVTGGVRIRF